jgi:hypothetical protein
MRRPWAPGDEPKALLALLALALALALYAVAWAVERPGGDRQPLGGAPVEEGATPDPP